MNKSVTPVVVSEDSERFEPMGTAEVFDVSTIPISTSRLNLLETDTTGLLLRGSDIVSELEHNPLVVNTDGKLYVRVKPMIAPDDQVLKSVDNLIRADVSMKFDPDTSVLSLIGKDRAVLSEIPLPVSPGLPTVFEILQNTVPPKPEGFNENPYKKSTYLHMRFRTTLGKETDIYLDMAKLVDIYKGGDGITVNPDTNEVSVNLLANGGLKFDAVCDIDGHPQAHLAADMPTIATGIVKTDDPVLSVVDGKITATLPELPDIVAGSIAPDENALKVVDNQLSVNKAAIATAIAPLDPTVLFVEDGRFNINLPPEPPIVAGSVAAGDTVLKVKDNELSADLNAIATGIISAGDTVLSVVDGKLHATLPPQPEVVAGSIAADDTVLKVKDNQLYADMSAIVNGVAGPDNILSVKDGKLGTTLTVAFDETTRSLTLRGLNDALLGSVVIPEKQLPEIPGLPTKAEFVDNPAGHDPGKYMFLQFTLQDGATKDLYLNVSELVDVYTGGNGINVNNNTVAVITDDTMQFTSRRLGVKVPQLVVDNDKIVRVVGNKIETAVGMKFDVKTGNLALVGVNDATVAQITIPLGLGKPRAADFLKDYQPEGATKPGNYLRIHFEAPQGPEDVFLNVDPLVDIYTAGDGIDITNNVVSVNLVESDNNALVVAKNGKLYVDRNRLVSKLPDNALTVSPVDSRLYVKPGVSADTIGDGLMIGSNGNLEISAASLIAANADMEARDNKLFVDTKPKAAYYGTGLTVGSNGKVRVALNELVDSASGLVVTSSGKLSIDPDALARLLDNKIRASVSTDTDNILRVGTDGKPYLPGDLGSL